MLTKILVVDDSASDRLIIRNMLSEYEVLTACDGTEAMRMLEEHDGINLVILDLNMPNMDGFQVLEAMQADDRFKKLRTIVLTIYDELENEVKGLKLGAVDYVRKPIHLDSLKARIDVHVELLHAERALEQRFSDQAVTLETIFEQIPAGIAISYSEKPMPDSFNEYFRVNPVFEELTGRTKGELLRLGWAAITHPDDLEEEIRNYERLLAGEIDGYAMDKRFIRPDGSVVWVHLLGASLALSENHQYNHITIIKDITERKMMEEKLIESERSKSVLLSHLQGMAYRCNYDRDWTMQFVSSGCFVLTGYTPEALVKNRDLSFNELIAPEHREQLWEEWARCVSERTPFRREYEITTATGIRKWVFEIGQGIYNDQGEVEALEGIIIDISDRKEMEDKLRYHNEHDEWTGLYNRRYLESILTRDSAASSTENRALVSVNLCVMHALSITYGFQYSQELIKRVAEELSAYCNDQTLLFSTHEYRFAFYKKGYKDRSELLDFCQSISRTLAMLLAVDRINVGIGFIEIANERHGGVELLMKNLLITSEEALLVGDGENHICFYDQELEERIHRREILQHDLSRVSVGENDDGLFLQFQPILDLRENRICGFEALARHNSDKLGLVSPLEFIPIIEKTKHIIPIGDMIIRKACAFIGKLRSAGYQTLKVSVNVSAIQLLSRGFVQNMLDTMKRMGVDPESIAIELTESAFSSDYDEINRILGQLSDHGINTSIDDFGTGYSSLSRERELNVNCLKVDKSFIDRLMFLKPEETITSDIISMAHKLGHVVVAEGVEHERQMEYLRIHGCDKIQGYLISRPLDPEAALEFVRHY